MRIRRALHNHRPSGLAQLVQHRLQRNRRLLPHHGNFRSRLTGFGATRFATRLLGRFALRAYAAAGVLLLACSCCSHRFCSSFAVAAPRMLSLAAQRNFFASGLQNNS